jgi:hypothetical protein
METWFSAGDDLFKGVVDKLPVLDHGLETILKWLAWEDFGKGL